MVRMEASYSIVVENTPSSTSTDLPSAYPDVHHSTLTSRPRVIASFGEIEESMCYFSLMMVCLVYHSYVKHLSNRARTLYRSLCYMI
ncbi:hypothetical protein LINPERHAP2_LOCUS42516 [Linum perenne]